MKRIFWTLFLRPDWYFISIDGDACLRPAFWNGVVWENRVELIEDNRINKVSGRVPPHFEIKMTNALHRWARTVANAILKNKGGA